MDVATFQAMTHPIRQKLVVERPGVLEIHSTELVPGAVAEVIVFVEKLERPVRPLTELFGKGKGLFATPEEADEYIRKEREGWDS